MADVNEIFDKIFLLENKLHKQGYEEGLEKGKERGWNEGYTTGLKKGEEIGSELGFYRGCIDCWLKLNENHKMDLKPRTKRVLESLSQLLDEFPTKNIETTDILNNLLDIRNKFKQVSSLLSISIENTSKAITF